MNISRIPLALSIVLLSNSAFAQNVYRDYDTAKEFSRYKTYSWRDKTADGPSLLKSDDLDRLVKSAVDRQLAARKLSNQTAGEADLVLTYYVLSKDRRQPMSLEYDESHLSIGSEIQRWRFEGNLIVDVIERESNRLVWRGVAPRVLYRHYRV